MISASTEPWNIKLIISVIVRVPIVGILTATAIGPHVPVQMIEMVCITIR